jgi:hypothetical protein
MKMPILPMVLVTANGFAYVDDLGGLGGSGDTY